MYYRAQSWAYAQAEREQRLLDHFDRVSSLSTGLFVTCRLEMLGENDAGTAVCRTIIPSLRPKFNNCCSRAWRSNCSSRANPPASARSHSNPGAGTRATARSERSGLDKSGNDPVGATLASPLVPKRATQASPLPNCDRTCVCQPTYNAWSFDDRSFTF